eukprot:3242669-Amphidinium_carterae.1
MPPSIPLDIPHMGGWDSPGSTRSSAKVLGPKTIRMIVKERFSLIPAGISTTNTAPHSTIGQHAELSRVMSDLLRPSPYRRLRHLSTANHRRQLHLSGFRRSQDDTRSLKL